MIEKVCFECANRYPACWGSCEKHKTAKEKFLKNKKSINADRYMDSAIKTVQYNGLGKARRSKK